MATLTIDNQTVTVPDGSNVLEAAKQLGIVIPHFCYHEALGAVGSCRLCAMNFEQGPVKGVQMACMVTAQDGMVVSTVDGDAEELRAAVIEWLMLNHPHDCPVCDEGGECQLQDMTIAGGHSVRRYRGRKRTWVNQDLGPFIEQEMNRCIQCYRCVRTYQDYCGGDDFGVMGSRNRLFYGRFEEGKLESPFSGNLADVCPTGVFSDKTYRFKSRSWDLEEAASICPHCSLGCSVIPGARYRQLQRVRAGVNRQTNGFFICDRGRFGSGGINHPERPRQPLLQGREVDWGEALENCRTRLSEMVNRRGPQSIALFGSARASLEANALLRQLAQELKSSCLCYEADARRDRSARVLAARLGDRARSLEQVRQSDALLLIGSDPLNEAPLLGLALRQAARRGASITVIDPRPVELPCAFDQIPLAPAQFDAALQALAGGESDLPADLRAQLATLAARLKQAQRPILCPGGDLLTTTQLSALIDLAAGLNSGLCPTLAGPNSFGAALLAGPAPDPEELINEMLTGEIKGLVCLETDLLRDTSPRLARALGNLELLVVIDALPNQTARRADIFLPSRAVYEAAGSFVNHEGRMLAFSQVMPPGEPLETTAGGSHPPRNFEPGTPGDGPRPAWAILSALLGEQFSLQQIRTRLELQDSSFAGLSLIRPGDEGLRISGAGMMPPEGESPEAENIVAGSLPLLVVEELFGSELQASYAPALDAVRPDPRLYLHPTTAAGLGLADGEQVRISSGEEHFSMQLRLQARMAEGLLLGYRLRGTPLELFLPGSLTPVRVAAGGDND